MQYTITANITTNTYSVEDENDKVITTNDIPASIDIENDTNAFDQITKAAAKATGINFENDDNDANYTDADNAIAWTASN